MVLLSKGNDDWTFNNPSNISYNVPSGMPVAVANPLISSPYGAGRVSARGPFKKELALV